LQQKGIKPAGWPSTNHNGRKGHQMEKQIVIDNAAIRIEYWQSEGQAHWRLTHPATGAQKTFNGSDKFVRALIETGTI